MSNYKYIKDDIAPVAPGTTVSGGHKYTGMAMRIGDKFYDHSYREVEPSEEDLRLYAERDRADKLFRKASGSGPSARVARMILSQIRGERVRPL